MCIVLRIHMLPLFGSAGVWATVFVIVIAFVCEALVFVYRFISFLTSQGMASKFIVIVWYGNGLWYFSGKWFTWIQTVCWREMCSILLWLKWLEWLKMMIIMWPHQLGILLKLQSNIWWIRRCYSLNVATWRSVKCRLFFVSFISRAMTDSRASINWNFLLALLLFYLKVIYCSVSLRVFFVFVLSFWCFPHFSDIFKWLLTGFNDFLLAIWWLDS